MHHKTVLITGASSGIGKACAERFAALGCRLIIVARRVEKLEALARELRATNKVEVRVESLDVRHRHEVAELCGRLNHDEKIDILINNAGLARGMDYFQDADIDHWEEMLDTNVKGLLYVTKAVLPGMLARQQGHIITIGSIAGHEHYAKGNVYVASKHAVRAITKSLRLDLNGTPIRVSEIAPGAVNTEFSDVRFDHDVEKAKKVYEGFQPLMAEDIADAVVYCATRPAHVNIAELVVYPVAQSGSTIFRQAPKATGR
jgi:NADP-dependent 3-hydroxy acid dehydrogenase YdfG